MIEKLNWRIVVREYLQNNEIFRDTLDPTESMTTLTHFIADASKHRARVNQLDSIGAFIKANVKHRVFMKLDRRYGKYFPE